MDVDTDKEILRNELSSCGLAHSAVERILRLHYNSDIIAGRTLYRVANELIQKERKRLKLTDNFPSEDLIDD